MKFSLQQLLLVTLGGFQGVDGHYGFPFAVINGVVSKRWEYIRPTTQFGPDFDYSGPSAMCGRNATLPLFPIKTVQVEAGSTIGFAGSFMDSGSGNNEHTVFKEADPDFYIYHDGPATAYLSKAPGELNDYAGDGDWFKIAVQGSSDGMKWDIATKVHTNMMNFTIPKSTPPGKYLMRAEHLNILTTYKRTEMYVSCAHIEVTGPGGGTPGPTTKFPAFTAQDSGIWLPQGLWYPDKPRDELKNWEGAGPKVWKG